MYKFIEGDSPDVIIANDDIGNYCGYAVFHPFANADIYEMDRLDIFIDINVEEIKDKRVLEDLLFDELVRRAQVVKAQNPSKDVIRFAHCCLPDQIEKIEYFESKPNFKHDEGMHIVGKEIHNIASEDLNVKDIEFAYLTLDDHEIEQLVEQQKKVFKNGYNDEQLNQIKSEEVWFSVAAKDKGTIVANALVIIKKDDNGKEYAWLDDLFVLSEYRKKGIAMSLLRRVDQELYKREIHEVRLEVWSSNVRAMTMYKKDGYRYLYESECSIGMML